MPRKTRLFRIFYTTLFTVLAFALFILTLLTPGDTIYQSYKSHRLGNIFIVTGVYVITLLLAILIYASRIFTNRSVIAGIPKPWVPVEKPDVPKSVRRLVVEGLAKSAIIAQQSRPRDRRGEDNSRLDPSLCIPATGTPPWGKISHPGWTAPDCPDMPNQEFEPVTLELPHLLEAKAVSLAPMDPRIPAIDQDQDDENQQRIPDERIVEILKRPRNMCLRDYMNHLSRLSLIKPPEVGPSFIRLYEQARFSEQPLTEPEFRSLLSMFAELLRNMTVLDPEIIAEVQSEPPSENGAESIRSGASSRVINPNTGMLMSSSASFASSNRSGASSRNSRFHPANAPKNNSFFLDRSPSDHRSLRSRPSRTPSTTHSLRPMPSNVSVGSSGASVIHRTQSQLSEMAAASDLPEEPTSVEQQ
ncbi:hypothetical protein AJ79_01984 [Helicocarpus griseus UAMH5409]|uniref:Defect at low temperature protein 1 n=1 Tax=Helicocarpus griseus UAMH5409 TaxID=1447875 RepID=A0A2B7XW52_9EURO|nr:hypothetical protein AJ79_01984 [Helicocarpus griseus UAMH5409]